MVFALVFAAFSALLLAPAVSRGGWAWSLAWPAASFALVALAYAGAGPRVFGKRADGAVGPLHRLALLPFLLLVGAVWHASRLAARGPAWCEVAPGVLIGRRLLSGELPPGVGLVIDLTAEFAEPTAVRTAAAYRSLPTLDAGLSDPTAFRMLVEEASDFPGTIYIHCAQGHGRTGMFAAAVLLARGLAANPADAVAGIRRVRPGIRLKPAQLRALESFANTVSSATDAR